MKVWLHDAWLSLVSLLHWLYRGAWFPLALWALERYAPTERTRAWRHDLKRRLRPSQTSPAYLNLSPAVGTGSATLSLSVGDRVQVHDAARVGIEPRSF